jgi:hypothetical protein
MEKYKGEYYDPGSFEKHEFETTIPVDLLEEIKQSVNKIVNYEVKYVMVNPENLSVMIGVMGDVNRVGYKISISSVNIND